jgi:hypothetical protein
MMKQFFTKKEMQEHELSAEIVDKKRRFITFNGKRILKRHEDYASDKYRIDNHWIKHWKNRTLYH